ncbi:MAG: M48 family metalloprotease [Lentimicrobiaceae bacterium]|nr:M48 family metalloprotease [Lentimicrobiaceae bacterium]
MKRIVFLVVVAAAIVSCDKENKTVNIFSVQDDIDFGREFDQQIRSSGEFNVVNEKQHQEAYRILNQYKDKLLATGKVKYADKFEWKVCIIDDATVNAFAVPGGYLYFYTGLIKVLDNEAEFVGVMAHEMGHVACRHSTKQLTKAYGVDIMLSMLLGKNQNQWVQIASELTSGLASLKFSRDDEYEADRCAVEYTYPTDWDARGVADFFSRMESQTTVPVFLSTHPSDEQRIKKVNEEWEKLGKKQGEYFVESYNKFKAALP